ncbi:hypothetical protein KVU_0906 [Ketogulonicigenium vulgare WSH-001]|uniref:Uncharacterized protein n=1 Tax=Ketogulonicigenium vulgare (strain WSH-001) TaxID=759362 RepID=F9Y5J2_KETVW|nr:hypothetical protein KVU_0906 [Ketogulonicigenium vulgare WSH-001]
MRNGQVGVDDEGLVQQRHFRQELLHAARDDVVVDHSIRLGLGGFGVLFQCFLGLNSQFALEHSSVDVSFRQRQRCSCSDVHCELLADFQRFVFGTVQRNQHADTAKALGSSVVNIGHDGRAFQNVQAAQVQVFADTCDSVGQHVSNGLAVQLGGFQHFNGLAGFQCNLGDITHQVLEVDVFANEVRFRVDLDSNTATARNGNADQTFSSDAISFFSGFSQAFGAQPVGCSFHIAIGFGQSFFDIHHACARHFAQLFNHCGGDRHGHLHQMGWVRVGVSPLPDSFAKALGLLASSSDSGGGSGFFSHGCFCQHFHGAQIDASGAQLCIHTVQSRACDQVGVKSDGACGIVVTRDHIVNAFGRAVGVNDRHNRDTQLVGFFDGQLLFVDVDDEQQVRNATHFADAAQRGLQFGLLALKTQTLFLGHAFKATIRVFVDLLQGLNALADGLPVGQRAAQPTVVDVVLCRLFSSIGDCRLSLTLGADEQHTAATGDGVAHDLQGFVQQRDSLRQVKNVDTITRAVDELAHTGVPARGLVTKVNACLKQLAHGELGKSHVLSFPVLWPRRRVQGFPQPVDLAGFLPARPAFACEVTPH